MAQLHPMVVHFPIALLLFGVLCDVARTAGAVRAPSFSTLGLWCTTVGLVMMLPAIGTGLLAHTFQPAPNAHVQDLINLHERLSYVELVLFGVLVAWRWDTRGDDQSIMPKGYCFAAAIGALMLMGSSLVGGQLVYVHGMGVEAPRAGSSDAAGVGPAPEPAGDPAGR